MKLILTIIATLTMLSSGIAQEITPKPTPYYMVTPPKDSQKVDFDKVSQALKIFTPKEVTQKYPPLSTVIITTHNYGGARPSRNLKVTTEQPTSERQTSTVRAQILDGSIAPKPAIDQKKGDVSDHEVILRPTRIGTMLGLKVRLEDGKEVLGYYSRGTTPMVNDNLSVDVMVITSDEGTTYFIHSKNQNLGFPSRSIRR